MRGRVDLAEGTTLGLLTIIALLLGACTSALWSVRNLLPADTSAIAPASLSLESRIERAAVTEPFNDLYLCDIVAGLLELQARGPESLRLTSRQARALRAFESDIVARLKANDQAPGEIDALVRETLTYEQRELIQRFRAEGRSVIPTRLQVLVAPFKALLRGAERP